MFIHCPWKAQLKGLFGDDFCRFGKEEEMNVVTLYELDWSIIMGMRNVKTIWLWI